MKLFPYIILLCSSLAWAQCNEHFTRLEFRYLADPDFKTLSRHSYANFSEAHKAITHDLFNGEIVTIKRFGENDNKHSLYLVQLKTYDQATGEVRFREAFFKPRVWGDEDGWARSPMEYVAYYLNLKLGMDYVPPTAYRKNLNLSVDGHNFFEGSFILKAPNFRPMASLPSERFASSHDEIISDHRIINVLLQNKDGHYHNLGIGSHWLDGSDHPVFIDWGASLRTGTNVTIDNYPAYGNSALVTHVRKPTLDALRNLTSDDLASLVRDGFISQDEAHKILLRRDEIVSYFARAK
jgi:hypothetical protein